MNSLTYITDFHQDSPLLIMELLHIKTKQSLEIFSSETT